MGKDDKSVQKKKKQVMKQSLKTHLIKKQSQNASHKNKKKSKKQLANQNRPSTTSLQQSLFFSSRINNQNRDQGRKSKRVNFIPNLKSLFYLNRKQSVNTQNQVDQLKYIKSILITMEKLSLNTLIELDDFITKEILDISVNNWKLAIITNNRYDKEEDYINIQHQAKRRSYKIFFQQQVNQYNADDYHPQLKIKNKQTTKKILIFKRKGYYAHGKLMLIRFDKRTVPKILKLRVHIGSINMNQYQIQIGGNFSWSRDFQYRLFRKISAKGRQFQNNLLLYLNQAFKTQGFDGVNRLLQNYLQINLGRYNFDRLENINLIVCPLQTTITQQNRNSTDDFGLDKIQNIMANFNNQYPQATSFRNINILSPYYTPLRYDQRQFEMNRKQTFLNLIDTTLSAFHGRQINNLNAAQRLRLIQFTNLQIFKALKYEFEDSTLLSTFSNLRKYRDAQEIAFDCVFNSQRADFHRFQSYIQDQVNIFSHFTVSHLKMIVCTHEKKSPDILFLGSQNYTPFSWGLHNQNKVKYFHAQIGVLIELKEGENVEQFLPFRLNFSNNNSQNTMISRRQEIAQNSLSRFNTIFRGEYQCEKIYYNYLTQLMNGIKECFSQKFKQCPYYIKFKYPIFDCQSEKGINIQYPTTVLSNFSRYWDFIRFSGRFSGLVNTINGVRQQRNADLIWIGDLVLIERGVEQSQDIAKREDQIRIIWQFDVPTQFLIYNSGNDDGSNPIINRIRNLRNGNHRIQFAWPIDIMRLNNDYRQSIRNQIRWMEVKLNI